ERCDVIISKMARWFETAHLAVFTMEKNIKEDLSTNLDDMQSLDQAIATMEPMVALLTEVGDIIEEKHEEQEDQTFEQRQQLIAVKVSITKIQSEWSGLQHFLSSIKAELKNSTDKRELTSLIENVLLQIDDLATVIFQFQEQRHDDVLLTEIDSKIEPLFNNIEKIYVRMTSQPPKDASGMLTRKYHAVQERWDSLQVDIDELKQELKEDRWLAVFRQVADQVNVMIDGLERTVAHCQTVIQTLKRSFPRLQHSSSSRQAESSYEANVPFHPPIDREKWNSTEKNFQSKYKYYTPAIDRMLAMVENGISTRITSTTGFVTQRHQVIMQRWQRLKSVMNQLLLHDLPEIGSERERAEASWMKPTKSVLLRHRSQSIDRSTAEHNDLRPKTPVARSKTPNPGHRRTKTPTRLPARPKSSLDKYNPRLAVPPHDRDRPSSSHRRSLTPSLIPRAKTPSNTSIPSLITRPRSSFANHSSYIPPKEASSESDTHIALEDLPPYLPDRKDPLDVEVANVVNASPIAIKCQRAPSTRGRYYFGNELSPSLGGGKKMYTCKLMDYGDRYARRNNGKAVRNKVLVRVGGGWQDLEMFLLEHASLM
ncbi:uncharacterized protein BYT42DRAFT_475359, partial [Radiomyces spectabilis]|uniref:uncharacterized protein n=1 Tax=Radiomyces spectabilis TaxID=64574 RepID=UPI00221E71D7